MGKKELKLKDLVEFKITENYNAYDCFVRARIFGIELVTTKNTRFVGMGIYYTKRFICSVFISETKVIVDRGNTDEEVKDYISDLLDMGFISW